MARRMSRSGSSWLWGWLVEGGSGNTDPVLSQTKMLADVLEENEVSGP